MALDERTRHALHTRLEEVLGPEHAAAAMTAYPPPGEELATKRDLNELGLHFEATLHRVVHEAVTSQTRSIMFALVGVTLTNASLTIGALALTS